MTTLTVPHDRPEVHDHGRILAAELVGTLVLMLGGPGTAILAGDRVGTAGVAAGFGISLLIMAYVIGPISGCQINPAVTLGMLLARKITGVQAVFAVAGQVIGAAAGGAIVYGIASGRDGFTRGSFASNGYDRLGFSSLGAAIVVEIILTALLVVVVLSSMGRRFYVGFGGLVCGLTLMLIHLISIPVDNTSVNPARSFGTAIFATFDSDALQQLWVFVVFPLVGAVVGVFVWLLIDDSRLEDTALGEIGSLTDARNVLQVAAEDAIDRIDDTLD